LANGRIKMPADVKKEEKADVEMKDTEKESSVKKAEEKPKEKHPNQILLEKLTTTLTRTFPQGVAGGENATLGQAVESFYFFRKQCQKSNSLAVLDGIMKVFLGQQEGELKFDESTTYPSSNDQLKSISDNVSKLLSSLTSFNDQLSPSSVVVECASFLVLLATVVLLDCNEDYEFGYRVFTELWSTLRKLNRRSTDLLSAKVCFYRIVFHSKMDDGNKPSNTDIRTKLLQDYRTCVLNHNEPTQAVIINLILQKYLEDRMISQAAKFCTKANLPERSEPFQIARYSFNVGRINVVQLQYGDALAMFRQALRKAPQHGALGFKQIVTKYFVVTMLLMGDIPERSIFRQEGLVTPLEPYLQLTQAVRVGNMTLFKDTLNWKNAQFEKDGVYMLITRLRHNVIKAALRKISVSYSRIHLNDVASKLQLESALEAEYMVAKAIKDGVIDAVLDHNRQEMRSTEIASVYQTKTPQNLLDNRIQYCLTLHQKCIKALRHKEEEEEEKEPEKKEDEEDKEDVEEIVAQVLDSLEKEEEE